MVGEGSELKTRTPWRAHDRRQRPTQPRLLWAILLLAPVSGRADPVPPTPPDVAASVPASAPTSAADPVMLFGRPELGAIAVTPASTGVMPPTMKARAEAWFTAKDDANARRAEMRGITGALKQPCRYCHTPAFDDYTDRLDISRQMMALSAEHGVTCAECHAGKRDYTELGHKAAQMWQLSHEQHQLCEGCHVPGKRFEKLSPAGLKFKKTQWKGWAKAHPAPKPPPAAPTSAPVGGHGGL